MKECKKRHYKQGKQVSSFNINDKYISPKFNNCMRANETVGNFTYSKQHTPALRLKSNVSQPTQKSKNQIHMIFAFYIKHSFALI